MFLYLQLIILVLRPSEAEKLDPYTNFQQPKIRVQGQVNSLKKEDDSVFKHEVEALLISEIDAEIEEVDDLKTQMAVLNRHVRKHSGSAESEYEVIDKIDKSRIENLENELKMKRKEIFEAKNRIDSEYVLTVNKMVEEAEIFLEDNYKKVYDALDTHLESEDHKNEHNHDPSGEHGHDHDSLSDYADLLHNEPKDKLIDFIDVEINEFEQIKEQKLKLENHLKVHHSEDINHGDLHLSMSEEILDEIDVEYLDKQEQVLVSLRNQIEELPVKLKQEDVETIVATMEKAEIFIEASNDRLELVGLIDTEMEDDGEIIASDNIVSNLNKYEDKVVLKKAESIPPTVPVPVGQYSTKTVEALKKAAEESHRFLHSKNLAGHHTDDVMMEDLSEEIPQSIIFILPVVFMVMIFIIVAVFLIASWNKPQKVECGEAVPDSGIKIKDRFGLGPKAKSPELLLEKEVQVKMGRRRRK